VQAKKNIHRFGMPKGGNGANYRDFVEARQILAG
jgi:hypothetical protein